MRSGDAGLILACGFMINAFAATGVVALVLVVVGYFLMLRSQSLASHVLSHVGFTGATLLGMSPLSAPAWAL